MTIQEIRDDEADERNEIWELIQQAEQDHAWLLECNQRADVANDIADQANLAAQTSKMILREALKERGAL